jgi:hypothetical protein
VVQQNRSPGVLDKPFFIVEGYDASRVAPLFKKPLNYIEIWKILNEQPISATFDFMETLDDIAGYDLVFLDFNDGTDDILRNVEVFKAAMKWIETKKATAANPQQNVILGMSMGGLIIRYGLADITKNGTATAWPKGTDTRLVISHDSPHQGANTPLGSQYLTRFLALGVNAFAGLNISLLPKIKQGNDLLNEPATEQLAILRATGTNSFTRNTFLSTTYRNMITFLPGDPIPSYKFIATSSGSECGTQIFSPGTTLLGVEASHFFPRPWIRRPAGIFFSLNVKSLPNQTAGSQSIFNMNLYARIRMFFSLISMTISLQSVNSNSPAGELPWDAMPGGTREVRNELDGDNLDFFPFNITMPFGLGIANASYTAVEDFCFVPITSSLDITNVNLQSLTGKYVGGISPGNPSRAANFIAQEGPFTNANGFRVSNNGHRFFTARNANWLFNEMQGVTPNDVNCSSQCQPSGFSINGPSSFCNSDNYVVDQFPSNGAVTITWSAAPSGIVTLTTNPDKSVTLTKIADGNVTLTATLTGCNFTNNAFSKTIHVGSYTSSDYRLDANGSVSGYLPWCPNKSYGFSVSNLTAGATGSNYVWTIPEGFTPNYISNYLCVVNSPYGTSPSTGTMNVSFTDGCGGTITKSMFVAYSSSACNTTNPCFIVSPNPAQNYVNVNVASSCLGTTYIRQIELVQASTGTSVYYQNYSYGNVTSTTINMYSYISGTYYVRVYDGSSWSSYTMIH